MRCPTLSELPPPPPNKTGWPWTEESFQSHNDMLVDDFLPKISIITPSFNQGEFIEETIRSVLLQGYPNLEYIIIDGRSKDGSVEIIKKYARWLSYWVSEPDHGQSQAINKGFRKISGQLTNWINSDDLLMPNALFHVAQLHQRHSNNIIAGACQQFDSHQDKDLIISRHLKREDFIAFWHCKVRYQQPSTFVPTEVFKDCGLLEETMHCCFDWEWMIRLLAVCDVTYSNYILSKFRIHSASKTTCRSMQFSLETRRTTTRYLKTIRDHKIIKEYQKYRCKIKVYRYLVRLMSRSNDSARLLKIFIVGLKTPEIFLKRFTWGAVRKILRGG